MGEDFPAVRLAGLRGLLRIDRHQLADFEPHLYRTRDGGRSWTPIVAGIREPPGLVDEVLTVVEQQEGALELQEVEQRRIDLAGVGPGDRVRAAIDSQMPLSQKADRANWVIRTDAEIAGGLYGIRNKLPLGEPYVGNGYEATGIACNVFDLITGQKKGI